MGILAPHMFVVSMIASAIVAAVMVCLSSGVALYIHRWRGGAKARRVFGGWAMTLNALIFGAMASFCFVGALFVEVPLDQRAFSLPSEVALVERMAATTFIICAVFALVMSAVSGGVARWCFGSLERERIT
ncbi:MAG: hypothetical protein AAGE80_00435 [Pseudomonadota bacterium]